MQKATIYFGLKARISQAWVAPPLVFLIIFIVKLALLKSVLLATLSTAERLVAIECSTLRYITAKAAQVPQDSVMLANELVNASLNHGVRSFMHGMSLSLTAVEELIYFALEMTIGTYACFTISSVNIGANEAINATEFVVKEANETAGAVGRELNKGLGKLSDFINDAVGLIDSVEEFITGGDSYLHSVNLTVAKLDHLNISSNINTKLEALRKDVPTYEGTTKAVKSLIAKPFDFMKTQIKNQNLTVNLKVNKSYSALSNTNWDCNSEKVQHAFQDARSTVSDLTIAFCVICGLSILCGIAWNVWKAKSHWNRLVAAASSTGNGQLNPEISDPFVGSDEKIAQRSIEDNLTAITRQLEFGWLERHVQSIVPQRYWWALHYCLTAPVVSFLGIGLAGIGISVLEIIIVQAFEHGTKFLVALEKEISAEVGGNAKLIYGSWCNQTNAQISALETQINTQLLGWVHNGSKGINQSISSFVNHINDDISSAFQGTGLQTPIQAVANCLFENKAREIEKGLTWVYGNSQISLPRVKEQIFANQSYSQLKNSKPANQARLVIDSALDSLHHELKVQFLCSGLFIALWAAFAVGAYAFSTRATSTGPRPRSSEKKSPKPSTGIKRSYRPVSLKNITISEPMRVRSPIERISDRVTQFFGGPARRVSLHDVGAPHQASILKADTPRTPLRAMIINA